MPWWGGFDPRVWDVEACLTLLFLLLFVFVFISLLTATAPFDGAEFN